MFFAGKSGIHNSLFLSFCTFPGKYRQLKNAVPVWNLHLLF